MTEPPQLPDDRSGRGMACARCNAWIQFRFPMPWNEIAHFIFHNEFVTLESFPVILYCPECGAEIEATGREMTIDIEQNIILRFKVDTPPGKVPDEPDQ